MTGRGGDAGARGGEATSPAAAMPSATPSSAEAEREAIRQSLTAGHTHVYHTCCSGLPPLSQDSGKVPQETQKSETMPTAAAIMEKGNFSFLPHPSYVRSTGSRGFVDKPLYLHTVSLSL